MLLFKFVDLLICLFSSLSFLLHFFLYCQLSRWLKFYRFSLFFFLFPSSYVFWAKFFWSILLVYPSVQSLSTLQDATGKLTSISAKIVAKLTAVKFKNLLQKVWVDTQRCLLFYHLYREELLCYKGLCALFFSSFLAHKKGEERDEDGWQKKEYPQPLI